jgi:hypothetical protein
MRALPEAAIETKAHRGVSRLDQEIQRAPDGRGETLGMQFISAGQVDETTPGAASR